MMPRVYMAFLGTNDYLPCTYCSDGKEIENVRFVQEATLGFFCNEWTRDDRILIFATEDAKSKNWLDNGHTDIETGLHKECVGLKKCIEKLNIPSRLECIPIPDGKSEEEIWQIFQIVFDSLKNGDNIVFDITHAFRSIPILAIVILNYSKIMKAVSIKGIYYGAFEVLGSIAEAKAIPIERRRVPLLDLTSLDQLLEWSIALDRFVKAGDAELVSRLANRSIKPMLAATRGQDQAAFLVREIADNMERFCKIMATCRGLDISNIAANLKTSVNKCKDIDLIKPLKPVFAKVESELDRFSGDTIDDGISAAEWCLEHNLIQQAYTILEETMKSHFVREAGLNYNEQNYRESVSPLIKTSMNKKGIQDLEWPLRCETEIAERLLDTINDNNELAAELFYLVDPRNDLNHAGQRKNARKPEKFKNKLKASLEKIRKITISS